MPSRDETERGRKREDDAGRELSGSRESDVGGDAIPGYGSDAGGGTAPESGGSGEEVKARRGESGAGNAANDAESPSDERTGES